jgi:hypothetical protein
VRIILRGGNYPLTVRCLFARKIQERHQARHGLKPSREKNRC